ncbi:MAG: DUF5054 domain-containing protein [Devosia sp.]|uniref:DUF5054 domain-containing protein n=1 Tax=Devosia sp. TaxID=1871048 RepID=UPI001AC09D35|nr:DUF5054 domain-containing protein [Devosia sp.]MBN9315699.1 DUF5054 domain-containing protein [Devosia sp.]
MTRTIHLVFKTHLDIGFTDHAARVRAQYHERFIPQAIDTGEHFFAEDPDHPRFIWTTGAWLIWDHLNSQDSGRVKRLERAIERGLIRWHALPFTTHSELMSPAVFRAGLSYGAELDRRFGIRTIAAKMTDVPGHTIGIVPLLAEAGVKFLHLGVNSASPPPDVPEVFRWRAPDGSEVVVMYQKSYGETHFPPGFEDGLGFAHTNDNIGPQSVPQTVDAWRETAAHHPDTRIVASSLDDYGAILWTRREEFPVVDLELADSWIHGAGTDPDKLKRFLHLQRIYEGFAATELTPARLAFGRGLTLFTEHTWGVDIKSYLRDEAAWDRPAFEAARASDYRFQFSEASWAEQRAYLDAAVAALDPEDRAFAERADETAAEGSGWFVETDPGTGDVMLIRSPSGVELQGNDGSLIGYRYESYNAADVAAHMDTYLTHRAPWAILDHCKPGLAQAATATSAIYAPDGRLELEAEAHAQLGSPARVAYGFRALDEHRLEIAVELFDKPANRMPEASFVTFTPAGRHDWQFLRMGQWLEANRVAARGGGQLQAVAAVRAGGLALRPLDTPLVAPVATPFMPFNPAPPDFSAGLRFNLHNNKWGTNFPMWWGAERFVARFVLEMPASEVR